jgi:hypothetical protein
MKRAALLLVAVAGMICIAALASQKKTGLLVLEWAAKEKAPATPVAILIEMGLKDQQPTAWIGRASVTGAKVVHREGYRFRPGDKLVEPDGWEASSRRQGTAPANNPALARQMRIAWVGVVLHLADLQPDVTLVIDGKGDKMPRVVVPLQDVLSGQRKPLWDGQAVVRRVSASTPVVTAKTEDDFPAAAYGPDGTLWLAYISYTIKDESRRTGSMQLTGGMQLKEQPADFKAYYTPEFGDQLFVKYHRDGKWSEPIAITGPTEDLVRCAIGVEGDGTAWVVYSANRQGHHSLYGRSIRGKDVAPQLGAEQRLTKSAGPELGPVMCTDQAGHLWLAHQSWNDAGAAQIVVSQCQAGRWTERLFTLGKQGSNLWYPAIAASPDGKVAVAYDIYQDGDYDVEVAVLEGANETRHVVAGSPRFEARPALAYDAGGRLWIAYEEGPEKWGKDYGALDANDGSPLYNVRSVRVACLADGKLMKPSVELPTSARQGQAQMNFQSPRYAYPKLGLDGKGRLWLTYRDKLPTPFGVQPGAEWLTRARRLDGDKWTEPIEIQHADGLLDSRPVLLPHQGGGLLVLTNTDGRYTTPGVIDNQIYAAVVDLPGEPVEPALVPRDPDIKKDGRRQAAETAAVNRIRDYRVEHNGKKLHLARGEFHRHTEISFDGGSDGSLEDMFRYAIDVAALDWIGNTDHDSGNGREYSWWLIQKLTDAYHVGKAFKPIFAYERSVQYPHGHRNCIFARRGIRTLPRLIENDPDKRVGGVHADDTKMLYRYLRELDGICASHTSATNMGTDWRDHDAQLEPLVEIYQGDRNSYEYEEAPRAGHDPQSNKLPVSIGGWRPAGFLNHAMKEKGYRLGFQSSSDHISTHISYCIVLAESLDREAFVTAMKKRHCYAATDDIILDIRSGEHLMGEAFKTDAAPSLQITAIGTKPLTRVDILKDHEVVATLKPGNQEYKGTWTDPKPSAGVHYYYVRAMQEDDELAWGSPMWIDYAK